MGAGAVQPLSWAGDTTGPGLVLTWLAGLGASIAIYCYANRARRRRKLHVGALKEDSGAVP